MCRYNDNAPIGNTCPIINDVVRYIEVFREQYDTNHPYIPSEMPKDWKYSNLYDLSMAYLKGEFKPSKEFYKE